VRYPFRPLKDGDDLPLGNVSLRVLHTPGHRPESITLLVTNHARSEAPSMAITGDTLLVGDVGRPDFGGEQGARELWGSVQRLLALDDYVEVFPSHFEGPCGKGMCGRPSSTIGFERRFNPVLQVSGIDEFVRLISAEVPARPLNMDAIVATNLGEKDAAWAMPQGQYAVPEIDPLEAPDWISARNPVVIDVREPSEYDAGHLPGAASLPQCQLADRLDEVPRDREVLVVCAGGVRSLRCAQFLKQAGYERVTSLRGGTNGWQSAGLPVEKPALA
jgi:rhodanese-related sulfurtransferase